jgi:hypothetical protein
MKKLLIPGLASFLVAATALNAAPSFTHEIPFELGASGFAPGDKITITSVRGDRKHIEPGGSYLVEGTYTLNSSDSAELALFCTTRGPSGSTSVQEGQEVKIMRNSGKFELFETNVPDGWLHVSFYPKGSSSGGVYFGEKGRETTIMRNESWFKPSANEANGALMAFLGNPVPRPADMDARYDKEHLLKAFTALCGRADLTITKLNVDDSEFPFLLYGTLDGKHTLPEKAVFEEQKGYTYGGSVRGSIGDGGTYFAVNMVPSDQYPEAQEKACSRRLMVRLQMLADRAESN